MSPSFVARATWHEGVHGLFKAPARLRFRWRTVLCPRVVCSFVFATGESHRRRVAVIILLAENTARIALRRLQRVITYRFGGTFYPDRHSYSAIRATRVRPPFIVCRGGSPLNQYVAFIAGEDGAY